MRSWSRAKFSLAQPSREQSVHALAWLTPTSSPLLAFLRLGGSNQGALRTHLRRCDAHASRFAQRRESSVLRGALRDRERPLSTSGVIELFHDANHQHQDAFFVALAGDDEGLADVGFDLQEGQEFLAAGTVDAGG